MSNDQVIERNIALVKGFYEGGTDSKDPDYGEIFHPDFKVTAPDYLPWGGTSNTNEYLTIVLPQVTTAIDFAKFFFDSVVADTKRVVMVVNLGVMGTDDMIKISEHWEFAEDGKALSLWVAYFEPKKLVEQIHKNQNNDSHPFKHQ